MNAQMKQIIPTLATVTLYATTGCISTQVVQNKARPHLEYNAENGQQRDAQGQPGYYALLPLTVAGDVATSPFQLVYFLFRDSSHSGRASIHGIPIPLP